MATRSVEFTVTDAAGHSSAPFRVDVQVDDVVTGEAWSARPRTGDVVISNAVLMDVSPSITSLRITPTGSLTFHPDRTVTLTSAKNIVVEGLLRAQPVSPAVVHRISFPNIVESQIVGGGMDPLTTDVGLWVMGAGVLDLQGSPKTAWAHVGSPTSGWRAGDQIVVAPTKRGVSLPTETTYQGVPITAGPNNPDVALGDGLVAKPEILNLTRNVVIEGAATGRAHILIRSTKPSTVRYVELRHMGPQIGTTKDGTRFNGNGVLGRYPLHWHHSLDGSRGTVVEGVVVHKSGNHAFVPHSSHGITLRNCIAHDVRGDAYWWDFGHPTHDLLWDRCVASWLFTHPENRYELTGFFIGKGNPLSNVCRGCVAFSVNGPDASGFFWNNPPTDGLWVFQDAVAHNCDGYGIRVWQNTGDVHVIDGFVTYHCDIGINHGAYGNPYRYLDVRIVACDLGIQLVAQSQGAGQIWRNVYVDAAGAEYAVVMMEGGPVPDTPPKIIEMCTFNGYTKAAINVHAHITEFGTKWTLRRNTFSGLPMWWDTNVQARSRMTFDGLEVAGKGVLPVDRPEWNASSN